MSFFTYTPTPGHSETLAQNVSALPAVVQLLVDAANELETPSQPFLYDLVDLTRQLLADTFNDLYMLSQNATVALRAPSLSALATASLSLLKDLDALLATNENYLLGQWIARARSWGTESGAEADQFEFNARNQVTLWGPDGQISDYAAKHWAGLVGDYYYMRWEMYFSTLCVPATLLVSRRPLADALLNASSFGKKFHEDRFRAALLVAEQEWSSEVKAYPTVAQGSAVDAAVQVLAEYAAPPTNYQAVPNVDMPSEYDIGTAMTNNVNVLAWICAQEPLCLGLYVLVHQHLLPLTVRSNNYGHFKYNVSGAVTTPSTTLYVKV